MEYQYLSINICYCSTHQRWVSDFVNRNGNWDSLVLREFLPKNDLEKIMFIPPPRISNADDSFFWRQSSDGCFSSSSAYLAVRKRIPNSPVGNFKLIWKWSGPMHGILQTNFERSRRRISNCNLCPICGGDEKPCFTHFVIATGLRCCGIVFKSLIIGDSLTQITGLIGWKQISEATMVIRIRNGVLPLRSSWRTSGEPVTPSFSPIGRPPSAQS